MKPLVLAEEFCAHIRSRQLFQKNDRLIIAVSGGADSVALCRLCQLAGYHFEMAHCNFQLRGEESLRDETFVRDLANKWGTALHVVRFDTMQYAEAHRVNTQIAARQLRYDWFNSLVQQDKGARGSWLLTAHHADDNVETLLIHFLKGTGMHGLTGIPERNGYIIRPLLFARKQQILDFMQACNQSFVEDSSNASDDYTRNYVRRHILPALENIVPAVSENLLDNIGRFRDIRLIYDEAIEQRRKKLAEYQGKEVHIPVQKLLRTAGWKTVLFEIVRDFGFLPGQLDTIERLLDSESGRYVDSATYRILRNRAWLVITPLASQRSAHITIREDDIEIAFEGGVLFLQRKAWSWGMTIPADPAIAVLDADKVVFPLLLRKWRQGDYFYPLGMSKKKKLSRFFIDQKFSLVEKERTWVIEQNQKILWVAGHRIDHRFRVTEHTSEVWVIRLQSASAPA